MRVSVLTRLTFLKDFRHRKQFKIALLHSFVMDAGRKFFSDIKPILYKFTKEITFSFICGEGGMMSLKNSCWNGHKGDSMFRDGDPLRNLLILSCMYCPSSTTSSSCVGPTRCRFRCSCIMTCKSVNIRVVVLALFWSFSCFECLLAFQAVQQRP